MLFDDVGLDLLLLLHCLLPRLFVIALDNRLRLKLLNRFGDLCLRSGVELAQLLVEVVEEVVVGFVTCLKLAATFLNLSEGVAEQQTARGGSAELERSVQREITHLPGLATRPV